MEKSNEGKKDRGIAANIGGSADMQANAVLEQLSSLRELLYREFAAKLPGILAGIPNEDFIKLLHDADERQLQSFKEQAHTEPLQHQLTLLGHYLEAMNSKAEEAIEKTAQGIGALRPSEMDSSDFKAVEAEIEAVAAKLQHNSALNSKALAVAWNTGRADLIETISHAKERGESLLANAIGAGKDNGSPTGLYAALTAKLFSVFGSPSSIEGLKDDEPAIEALAKLSLWHPHEYKEVGLLGNIEHKSEEKTHLKEVGDQLEKYGLKTVKDLKKARIFSKKTLAEHIKKLNKG